MSEIAKYLAERKKMTGVDGDIHCLNVGSEREAILRVDDIEALRAENELMRAALRHALVRLEWRLMDAKENGHPDFIADSETAVDVARNALAQVAK